MDFVASTLSTFKYNVLSQQSLMPEKLVLQAEHFPSSPHSRQFLVILFSEILRQLFYSISQYYSYGQ